MPKISIVCPTRNEEQVINLLCDVLLKIQQKIISQFGENFVTELVFIDNASTDSTVRLLKKRLVEMHNCVLAVHAKNRGFQNSILSGLKLSSGDCVILLQSDLQDPPEVILEMLERWVAGNKYVVTKIKRRGSGIFDFVFRSIGYLIIKWVSGAKVILNASDFWLIDKSLRDIVISQQVQRPFFRTLLPAIQKPDSIIRYVRTPRTKGVSNFGLFAKYEFFMDAVLSDTRRLLLANQLIATSGLIFFTAKFFWSLVEGYYQSLSILLIGCFVSIIFLILNLLVEFVSRLYVDIPEYISGTDRNISKILDTTQK